MYWIPQKSTIMDRLYDIYSRLLKNTDLEFKRYIFELIDWNDRFIALLGARGVGKTTLMLQYLKENYSGNKGALYVSLDDIYFSNHRLVDFAEDFYNHGGQVLFLDEVHKYPSWSGEIKNLYDSYPDMQIVFSGSSVLDIYKGRGDLSRRVSGYLVSEMSLREYVELEHGIRFPSYSLNDVFANHMSISRDICEKLKPLAVLDEYFSNGCYPYYKDSRTHYSKRLQEVINTVLESDIPITHGVEYKNIIKLKSLIEIISSNVPFVPNMSKLASVVGLDRKTLYHYLEILSKAGIILLLKSSKTGLARMRKAEKIFPGNVNILMSLSDKKPDIGNLRETFIFQQLRQNHRVDYSEIGDFLIDGKYYIEVGGRNKSFDQVKDIANSYLVIDDIETGRGNRIPLWLFGFLY